PGGWQEPARAGLGLADVIQYGRSALPPSLPPELPAQSEANVALSRGDVETAVAASAPVIVSPKSHCYLDVPYAESSADPGQAESQGRVGQRGYSPKTVAGSFDWEPAQPLGSGRTRHVPGVEAPVLTRSALH